ncbi:polysaccharide pyruvyl transferase family protein [Paenibacillus hemerocallicola]|uniref:Polysaccharide pyruvyl transferase family protein n=2 Tax=Paenibacillus hemerocallicola TaxID=1172614 RepID=A0A5C4T898_9BACL|nr:polysaccharide pyruvyl transferase family protein [Paenibacillus hemerocallicola]
MWMEKHLFAAYAWSFHHVGDTSIMPGLLSTVHRQKPGVPVHVMAYQVESHRDYPQVGTYLRQFSPNSTVHPNVFRRMLQDNEAGCDAWRSFVQRWGRLALENFEKGRLGERESAYIAHDLLERLPLELLEELRRNKPEIAMAIADAGFAVYNSSTSLSYGRLGVRNLWKAILPMMMPMLIARAANVPYGFSPLSFEALDWPIPLLYRPLFGDARFLYCRDSDSLRHLQQHGLLNRSSGVRPDNCLYFEGDDEPWAESFMEAHGLKDKGFIGLMLRIPDPAPGSGDPLTSSVSAGRIAGHMRKNKEFLERWIAETGMKVLICHETTASINMSREALWGILSEEIREHCVYMDDFWNAGQARSMYRRMRMLVSMELHSALLALTAGTPVIHHPLSESGRKKEMLHDYGIGDWLLDMDACTSDELAAVAVRIHKHYPESERRVRELMSALRHMGDATVSEMALNWRCDP